MFKFDYLIYNNDLESTRDFIMNLINIENTDFIPSKHIDDLNLKKVNKSVNKLIAGKTLKPVEITYNDNKVYIIKGDEKFVASLIANRLVCKKLVDAKPKISLDTSEIMEWKSFIRECQDN